ncbi:MAG: hypothetical protein ACRDAM_03805 [Casimicrobium sp.]
MISAIAAITCALSGSWISSAALFAATLFATWKLLETASRIEGLKDWLIALEGKDPFNPDVKPNYEWRGFVTTFVAALNVKNHPVLSGKTLFVFRDEIEDDAWRKLVTRIRHGAHTHAYAQEKRSLFRRFFE